MGSNKGIVVTGTAHNDVVLVERLQVGSLVDGLAQGVETLTVLGRNLKGGGHERHIGLVNFILYAYQSLSLAALFYICDVGIAGLLIEQPKHDARFLNGSIRATDAYLFHLVGRVTDTGSINETEQHAVDLHRFLDGVAGRAMYIRDNGAVIANELVEQGALAYIRLTDNGNGDTLFDDLSGFETLSQTDDMTVNSFGYVKKLAPVGELQVFMVGEVEFKF